jgi:hypothetical protein
VTVAARALLAGGGAARALACGAAGGEGSVEIVLGKGGYVLLGDDGWILIAGERATVGPLSLLVAGLGERLAEAGSRVRVEDGALLVGAGRIALDGLRVAPVAARAPATGDAGAALAAACACWPDVPDLLRPGLRALEAGDTRRAVGLLAGLGEGLTPAGDDVLAGYAGWEHAAGRPLELAGSAAGRTSPISLAYLRCAERGELPDPAAATLAAVRAGDAAAARRRARTLSSWGTTSGPALLWGMAAARRAESGRGDLAGGAAA